MRKWAHRTPHYIYHRTRQMLYERGHLDDPWLTPAAIRLLESLLRPADRGAEFGSGRSTIWFAERVAALTALGFPDAGLDFALVDGHYRDYSAKFILPKIKSGGILIIDNVNWYLPSKSRAPNSRTRALGPNGKIWAEVAGELAQWRSIWTSSGVWDTAMFIRP